MGDTGSQSLEHSSSYLNSFKTRNSFGCGRWSFVIETLSVMLQVFYYKSTKGKRLFLMAPFIINMKKKVFLSKKLLTDFGYKDYYFAY